MSYKPVERKTTVSAAISDAFSALEELASECREIVDNASEGLSQTQRIQTLDETASNLEGLSEPSDVPADVADRDVTYVESVQSSKRRGPSRAVRCSNACSMLYAAQDSIQEWVDTHGDVNLLSEDIQAIFEEAESLIGEVQEAIDAAEGCEFPGMFG